MGHNEEFRFGTPKKPTPHLQNWYSFFEKKQVPIVGDICSLEMNFDLRFLRACYCPFLKNPVKPVDAEAMVNQSLSNLSLVISALDPILRFSHVIFCRGFVCSKHSGCFFNEVA